MKCLKVLFCMVTLLSAVLMGAVSACAAQYEDIEDQYERMLDGIPSDIAELLPDGVFSRDIQQIGDAAEQMSSFDYIISNIGEITSKDFFSQEEAL